VPARCLHDALTLKVVLQHDWNKALLVIVGGANARLWLHLCGQQACVFCLVILEPGSRVAALGPLQLYAIETRHLEMPASNQRRSTEARSCDDVDSSTMLATRTLECEGDVQLSARCFKQGSSFDLQQSDYGFLALLVMVWCLAYVM
jgi:hypothetical protein